MLIGNILLRGYHLMDVHYRAAVIILVSMLVIAAVFAASMLAVSVVVEAFFDDADARRKSKKNFIISEPILIPISLPNPSILNQLV